MDDVVFALRQARGEPLRGRGTSIPDRASETGPALRKILHENIVPFWLERAPDPSGNGYRLNHDIEGVWKGPAPRGLVAQCRTLWSFARLAEADIEARRSREAGRTGFRFLSNHLWDGEHGGFFWEVDHDGERATRADKLLYGQAFAIFALSQYAKAADDPTALRLADRTFELVDDRLHDASHGGYHDAAGRDWSFGPDPRAGEGRDLPGPKRMDSHLHLLEALTAYGALRHERRVRDRLRELILILSNAVVHKTAGVCTDRFRRDWSAERGREAERVSYGHDLENVVLLMDACSLVDLPDGPLLDLYATLFDNVIRHGYDRRHGGFYAGGRIGEPADRREKVWWVQAEGLVSALRMYRRTGESRYEECYLETLRWIVRHQADWEGGGWYATISPRGRPSDDKASEWKAPYHTTRAVLACLASLADDA